MAYLGFTKQFAHNNELKNAMNAVKGYSLSTAERYGAGFGLIDGSLNKGMGRIEEDAAELAKMAGSPGDEAMIAKAKAKLEEEHYSRANSRLGRLNTAYENVRDKAIGGATARAQQLGLNASDAAAFAQQSWDLSLASPGIGSVFRQTASDRATALNITRFRATDGAMDTLGSIGSLLYKDNEHLQDGIVVAGVLGGVAAGGMVAGKVIGAGLDAALVDRD